MNNTSSAQNPYDVLMNNPELSAEDIKMAASFTHWNREFFRREALRAHFAAGSLEFDPNNPHVYAYEVAKHNATAEIYLFLYELAQNNPEK